MRNEMKYLIGGVVFGFVFFMILLALVTNVYASEVDELSEIQESEIVQDEQAEMSESPLMESDQTDGEADQPPQESEIAVAVVQDEQSEVEPDVYDHGEIMGFDAVKDETRIESFASGVIVGELADLLQENVIENDGYTDESWQRYEEAVAAGWDAISNFMTYTNDEVRAVIDELQAAIAGLEYPAGKPTFPIDGADSEFVAVGLFSVVGSTAGLAFVNKWQLGI